MNKVYQDADSAIGTCRSYDSLGWWFWIVGNPENLITAVHKSRVKGISLIRIMRVQMAMA